MSRVLAIDYGTKAVGLAISDELRLTVRPLATVRRQKKSYQQMLDEVRLTIEENDISTVVVGLPLNMDGSQGPAASRVESFIRDLHKIISVPILKIDERLTSLEADRILRERGVSERERKLRSDEYAATIILQDFLDGQSRLEKDGIK